MSKLALLFPGQGAQFVGMGRGLFDGSKAARAVFEEAQDLFGQEFLRRIFEGPEEALLQTETTQPAIYTVSVAAYAALKEAHPEFEILGCGGLSLGEYAALTAAGVLDFARGLELVRSRSLFMQEALERNPGTMAAVMNLEADKVREICTRHDRVYVANYNCPGQIVITGSLEGVKTASEELLSAGARKVIPLSVSGAFHSPFMETAREKLLPLLKAVDWKSPKAKVASNVLGGFYPESSDFAELLGRQIVEGVRWEEDVRALLSLGVDRVVEVGPGNVLQGLMRKISRETPCLKICTPEEAVGLS